MKKIFTLISFICFLNAGQAQLLNYEPFNYTPDATMGLFTQSGGAWTRLNSGDSILVTTGNLIYAGLPTSLGNKITFDGSGSDYYKIVTSTPVTSGSVYYSFILNVSSLGGLNTTGGYFTSIAQAASTTSYGSSVWTKQSSTSGKYNIGVSTRSNSTVSWLSTDLDPGTSYFIVIAYDIISGTANDLARIWLNTSAIGGAEPAADATSASGTDLGAAGIDKILLRQDNTTNTPFINIDEQRVGTTWASVTPSGAVPTITLSPLTSFGNVCINTTAGPNSFTISGANLTNADINVAALAGYTYATTAGGTYTTTLTLSQPGGTYSQQVFVKFNPTAVQSYNGNIAVSGGGVSTAVNASAVGSGVNSAPTVTTGSATSITQTSATAAGTITDIGCSAITAYGIEYSTTNNFPTGTGTQVASSNLSGGNFSSNLVGLAMGTVYYYRAYATNGGGTTYGAQQSFTTVSASPTITTTPLTAFGNVCINTTAGPNSFTINGTNLTNANVSVAAIAGYTYATTSGGTYTTSLSLTQPGGTYTQQIFVKFSPTAVQSYNGNIAVGGGGVSTAVNVAATGAGVNDAPSLTTGSATAITQTSATTAGTITATGCSTVSAYGIEYSTTNNFAPGTGTQVASSNLSAGGFSSSLTGLTPSTTYYYRAYATNGGGTAYGAQMSFTTVAPTLTITALTSFGNTCINNTMGPNSFTISGVGLTNANVNVGPLSGYSFATTSGGTYTASLSLTQPGGAYNQTIYVKFTPTAAQSYTGLIPVNGGGATATTVAADGTGVNTMATVITGSSSNITNHSVTVSGAIASIGCSIVTEYGIELSGINGFIGGTGTKYASSNLSVSGYSVDLNNLVQGATYYYKAYATNNGGTSYGLQQSFTVTSIGNGFMVYPSPAQKGAVVRVTQDNLKPGFYGVLFYNISGQLVYQYNMNVQSNFINQAITLPNSLVSGMYRVTLVNNEKVLSVKTIQVF